jgi:hypothetical protein
LGHAEVIGAAPAGATILQIERQLDEGPVLTAYGLQDIVSSGDLSTDMRWRRFGPAVADLQLQSVVAVRLARMASRRNEDVGVSARIIVDEARREAHLNSIAVSHLPHRAE